jgi:hypothetical protein
MEGGVGWGGARVEAGSGGQHTRSARPPAGCCDFGACRVPPLRGPHLDLGLELDARVVGALRLVARARPLLLQALELAAEARDLQ